MRCPNCHNGKLRTQTIKDSVGVETIYSCPECGYTWTKGYVVDEAKING